MPAALPDAPAPFVLLDDARPAAAATARLYRDPVGTVAAYRPEEVVPALDSLRAARASGLHAAGYLAYEAGLALEPALAPLASGRADGEPLLWFGLFEQARVIDAAAVPDLLPPAAGARFGPAIPAVREEDHAATLRRVLDWIRAGDIYQANITIPATVDVIGDPLAAYAAIRPHAAMGHGAIVRHDGRHILSFSPESFFDLADGVVETRPMKGTARRRLDARSDRQAVFLLRTDPKQRAENLMIVDLLRNDLSRVCMAGSVRVPDLFSVESYPTVHQMVSRVTGRLRPGADVIDVLRALFPCGSITGAPKIRAMEIIHAVEARRRGVYTGSIGSIDPDGNARFSVAIRTISLANGARQASMGLGSGIVADSQPASEWLECLDKARFVGLGTAWGAERIEE